MRILLVLLAFLSGLSLSDVGMAASRAQVVGSASSAPAAADAPAHKACTGQAAVQKPTGQTKLARVEALPKPAHINACTIRIPDRPRE
jgi:hypothetical protein